MIVNFCEAVSIQGDGGKPERVEQAQGILVAALGVLAGWYRYGGR
jgi:hypothetical protein